MNKIHPASIGLCGSCRHVVWRASVTGKVIVHCNEFAERVREPVARCSDYEDKNTPTKRDFYEIGWVLRTDKKGGPAGFGPPRKDKYGDPVY